MQMVHIFKYDIVNITYLYILLKFYCIILVFSVFYILTYFWCIASVLFSLFRINWVVVWSRVAGNLLFQGRRLSTLLVSVANKGLKRVGSATNLAPPGGPDCANQGCSISLPPSPQHSPCPSRKVTIIIIKV